MTPDFITAEYGKLSMADLVVICDAAEESLEEPLDDP